MTAAFQAARPHRSAPTINSATKTDRALPAPADAVADRFAIPVQPNKPGPVRLASIDPGTSLRGLIDATDRPASLSPLVTPAPQFGERFVFDPPLVGLDGRVPSITAVAPPAPDDVTKSASPPARTASPAPAVAAPEAPRLPADRPVVRQPATKLASLTPAAALPSALQKSLGADAPPAVEARTAIYDIAAKTVYLPNGKTLEAHSGLGDHMDDVRKITVKDKGPTPPNVYRLALREQLFHGVRAIRLLPADEDKMFGRDGMLAHSYMLGPSGQSNGCVSFSDYTAFLNAYLNGEIDRLVVVERLDKRPDGQPGGWFAEAIASLFKPSTRDDASTNGRALSFQ